MSGQHLKLGLVLTTNPMYFLLFLLSTLRVALYVYLRLNPLPTLFSSLLFLFGTLYFITTRPCSVYLLDFACFKSSDALKCPTERFMKHSTITGAFTEENLAFQKKMLQRSGLGESTYFPEVMYRVPVAAGMADARKEAETVMFGVVGEVLRKTGVKPKEIGMVIVNCSLFEPTPSFSAMIINKYKLREDVISYNLGGMGCSAGLISIDLAKQLLQVHPNTYALVVSTENMTVHWYRGNNRSMLVSNCLFRMGGAAILLTNHPSDRARSKYRLLHTLRTHTGSDDRSHHCVIQDEDSTGRVGVSLSKDLMKVAGDALKTNITALGPLVLPLSERLKFAASFIARRGKPYVPDFKRAFEHFCVHAGGRAVLDEVERRLGLSEWDMEPSRMTLYRFGNTSSSSLWYELAYAEAKGRVKRGDRVWQVGFGSGFKCNSAVWQAIRTIDPAGERSPWTDEIDSFPVDVPKVEGGCGGGGGRMKSCQT